MRREKSEVQAIRETIPLFDEFAAQLLNEVDLSKFSTEQREIITQILSGYLFAAILGLDEVILRLVKQEFQEWEQIDSLERWVIDFIKRLT